MSGPHHDAFVAEAEDGITTLNNALLALEDDPSDAAAMDEVFRVAHTLKGNAGAMGYDPLQGLAHALEDLLDAVRDGDVEVTPALMDQLFEGVDLLEAMVADVAEDGETTRDASDVETALRGAIDGAPADADDTDDESDDAAGGESTDEDGATDGVADAPERALGVTTTDDEGLFRARVTLSESDMPGVDAMFVLEALEADCPGFVTDPEREAVEDGDFEESFDCYLAAASAADVADALDAITQVEAVDVARVDVAAAETAGGTAAEADADGDETTDGADAPVAAADADDAAAADGAGGEDDAAADDSDADAGGDESGDGDDAGRRGGDDITSVRVDVEQLDDLYGLVEQLVTVRIKLRREIGGESGRDSDNLEELEKISSNLQETVMDMRLVPLSAVVETFPRLVRDLARGTDKRVNFEMEGTDIELDRTILTEIRDPLMHLLRNAVDHGIEPPEEREAAGKDPTGEVTLSATQERDHVLVSVSDDGGGLDVERIREKAVAKGVKSRPEVEAMDDEDVYDLVFHPGFSTNEEVTDVSGRGVGMDVVHTTVTQLDGTVSVDSAPGEGTTVTLRLPVSLAIVKVLFVEVDGAEFGVPVKNVAEVARAERIDVAHGEEVVEHDGDIYPVIRLREELRGVASATDGGTDDYADAADATAGESGMLLRVHTDHRPVCLHCDAVVDQEEVVVKPLEGVLSGTRGISGTAVLGEGDVVPILDVGSL
ncbi:MAG: ATP-binding protein [Halarchaeum sp.]